MKINAKQSPRFVLAVLALLAVSVSARGQGAAPPAAAPAPPDFSKVEIKTTKLGPNFYTLEGQGGTIGMLVGPDGIFLVDSEFAPLTPKIVAAIKQVSGQPIRFLVNTHVHGDHTGGNENFGNMGVTIIARQELRDRLAHPAPAANGNPVPPAPAAALPSITYENGMTLHLDGENVELIPVPRAHTDGDTMVRFPVNDVIMTGDFFRSVGYPFFDRANGGTLNGLIEGLNMVLSIAGPNTKIVPGHGAVVDRAAIAAHRDMIQAIRDRVAAAIQQGKTSDEVVAAHLTTDYDSKVPMPGNSADRFVAGIYAELKGAR
jgi:cyclase